jgi:hypothetical protein
VFYGAAPSIFLPSQRSQLTPTSINNCPRVGIISTMALDVTLAVHVVRPTIAPGAWLAPHGRVPSCRVATREDSNGACGASKIGLNGGQLR